MSIDKVLPNEAVIPTIESDLFVEQPDYRFAVGVLAVDDQVVHGLDREYAGYYELRRNVYVYQTGQLDESEIKSDGTDRDEDDARSIAFGVIENRDSDQRVIASLRLILKRSEDDSPLPIEEFCPDVFVDKPAAPKSIEVSRLISRHEKTTIQNLAKWMIYSVALVQIHNQELGPTYGIVEPLLERELKLTIPVSRIGEPRYVDHYRADNLPIEVDTENFIKLAKEKHPQLFSQLMEADGKISYFGKAVRNPARDVKDISQQAEVVA